MLGADIFFRNLRAKDNGSILGAGGGAGCGAGCDSGWM
jgi:hypothetical protein